MSTFIDAMVKRAQAQKQTIVLPEGNDMRTLAAAERILERDIADLIILGREEAISASPFKLEKARIIDPLKASNRELLAQELYDLRKEKGLSQEQALELMDSVVHYGVMMVKTGLADGMVAGARHSTGDVLRPCLQILKTAPGTKLVSAFFIMDVPHSSYGEKGVFLFADAGLEVQPNAERLAAIAVSSAQSWRTLMQTEPCVAMLSHSTYGSAKNDDASKVIEATTLAKAAEPSLLIDGELQLDAALVPSVASSKAPDSVVAGKANVLVFPDLDSGNIGYKLVQRLAQAEAYGPIVQGLALPVNDLSRGCSFEDIVGVVAITCVQAQEQKKRG